MISKLRGLLEVATIILVLIIIIPIVVCLSPIFMINDYFEGLSFNKKYNKYLSKIDQTKFFCYSSRRDSRTFIEKNILPLLGSDINVLFLNGKNVESNYEKKFMTKVLYSLKDKKGFPYIIKIHQGEVLNCSLNNEVYNTMVQQKSIEPLIQKINSF